MKMAINLPTKARSWEVVKRAEEMGYDAAWFYDTGLLNAEMLAAMGASAMVTSKIKLCTGVAIPSSRVAPVMASGLATINAMSPGRVRFGVSSGYTGRRTFGLGPVKQKEMADYIRVVQALLRGETTEWNAEGGTHKIRFLNPELDLININDPIPTVISAFGPKARQLAANLGAGWIGPNTWPDREKAEIDDYHAAFKAAGHKDRKPFASLIIGGRVLDDGEAPDSKLAMAQAGPYAAIVFHNIVETQDFGSVFPMGDMQFPFTAELEAYTKVYQQYQPADARYLSNHRGHLMFVRPEEKHINGNVIGAFTLTGPKSACIERLKGIKQMGFDEINFHMVPGHEEDQLRRWAAVMEKV